MNHFAPGHTAARYATGRPYFHEATMQRIAARLQLTGKLERALDVACGTGLSTRALLLVADQIEATDTSAEMLRYATPHPQINYAIAPADQQPFPDASFDLITVCSGVHWFDIDSFLAEAKRLLKPGASLVLYDNFFLAEMEQTPVFRDWHANVYLQRYPAPPRNHQYDWSAENMVQKGFSITEEEPFTNTVSFTQAELILYFTTQSNISISVEQGGQQYADIEAWLGKALVPFFDNEQEKRSFIYGNRIQYLRKLD